jgi:hypothetical protein
VLSGEATNTNYIVFGLTRSGLEPTIYHTRDEYANHYTTDAVETNFELSFYSANLSKEESSWVDIPLQLTLNQKVLICAILFFVLIEGAAHTNCIVSDLTRLIIYYRVFHNRDIHPLTTIEWATVVLNIC